MKLFANINTNKNYFFILYSMIENIYILNFYSVSQIFVFIYTYNVLYFILFDNIKIFINNLMSNLF